MFILLLLLLLVWFCVPTGRNISKNLCLTLKCKNMDDIRLEKCNALKEKINRINSKLYSLQRIKEQFNNGHSNVGLNLDFVNVKILQAMHGTIGVDGKLTKIIIETTIDYYEQILDILKKEFEEL